MAWVATAVVTAAVVGGGAQIYGAHEASKATEKAAGTASSTELEMFYKGREDTAPWREAGGEALNRLSEKIAAGPGEFIPEAEPGYQFGYEELVEKPLLRGAAASGGLGGGRMGKELTRYASDYATSKYDNFLDRWYKSLTPDQSLAGVGQTVASQGAQNALATGQMVGSNQLTAGIARGTGYQNMANTISQTAGGLGQTAVDAYYMNKYMPPAATPTTAAATPNIAIT